MSMNRQFYVYEWFIVDTLEVFYVGKGKGLRRFETKHRNKYFKNIFSKYNCDVRIHEMGLTEREAWGIERERIAELKFLGKARANFHEGGQGGNTGNYKAVSMKLLGLKKSDQTRIKISLAKRGSLNPFYGKKRLDHSKRMSGKNNPMFNKSPFDNKTEEEMQMIRENMRKANSGENNGFYGKNHKENTKEILRHKSKIRFSTKENHPFYGKHHTDTTKEKIGLKSKGRIGYWKDKKLSFETKDKISKSKQGSTHSEETRVKMSLRMTGNNINNGRKQTHKTKEKISIAVFGGKNPSAKSVVLLDNNQKIVKEFSCKKDLYEYSKNNFPTPNKRPVIDDCIRNGKLFHGFYIKIKSEVNS